MKNNTFFNEEMKKFVYDQFLKIWIQPEIEKRKLLGILPESFDLYSADLNAAQVIFYPDERERIVRINNEIKAIVKVKFKIPLNISVGDYITENQIESFESFKLTEEDSGDCGHITMKKINSNMTLFFDARYNKELARKHLDNADEFYQTAKYALRKGLIVSFIDNLFSTTELTVKAMLLLSPLKKLRESTLTHGYIKSLVNKNAKMKNIKHKHADLYNELYEKRPNARYLKSDVKINLTDARRKLRIAKDMIEYAKSCIKIE